MKWSIQQILNWTGGKLISEGQSTVTGFDEFSTDTRKPCQDKIFIALKGDEYDAHEFLDQAVAQGASAIFIHRLDPRFESLKSKVVIIQVPDTLRGLQDWAHHYRKTLKAKFFAVTGSNGKTTTKEFLASLLSAEYKTYFTEGSFNNHWGLPFSLLNVTAEHQCVVLEMGMNHAGEIARLVEIADPDYVACTMVGTAHIEHFGSQKAIAKAKEEIYQTSREATIRIFNQDQELTFDMMYPIAKKYPASRMLSFSGINDQADVYFKLQPKDSEADEDTNPVASMMQNIGLKIIGKIGGVDGTAKVPIFGEHNIINLMTAATMVLAAGMRPEKIWQALSRCGSAWGRNEFISTVEGIEILFDGYNANPDSMKALFKNVQRIQPKGKKIAALGQMKELGTFASQFHKELAQAAVAVGFEKIFFYGENFKDFDEGLKIARCSSGVVAPEFSEALKMQIKETTQPGDLLVIKGSRGAKTENYVKIFNPINWKSK